MVWDYFNVGGCFNLLNVVVYEWGGLGIWICRVFGCGE